MVLLRTADITAGTTPVTAGHLSTTAQKLYSALCAVADLVGQKRKYHPKTSQITFFAPVDAVAMALGVSRQTIYNRLPELASEGLVDQKGHFCTLGGQTRSDGSLWAVKMFPDLPGKAKIDFDWLKRQDYRNLGADIETGRTAWAALQSYSKEDNQVDISYILTFAITPTSESITNDCKENEALELESLLDIPYVPLEGRNEAVDATAKAVSAHLGAGKESLNFWRWLVWNLIRLEQQQKGNYFYQVFLMIQRVEVDKREGACKNPSGLFVSRLKQSFIWEELRQVKLIRVGRPPPS